ncbi:MAG: sortase [Ruminococcus sp.]|jgi:sortase B|nr:sortase [Ruminococcus sp.]
MADKTFHRSGKPGNKGEEVPKTVSKAVPKGLPKAIPSVRDILPFYQSEVLPPEYLTKVWDTGAEFTTERMIPIRENEYNNESEEILEDEVLDEVLFDDDDLLLLDESAEEITEELPKGFSQKPAKESPKKSVTESTESVQEKPKYSPFPAKGDSLAEIIRKLIFIISVTAFIIAAIIFISTLIQSDRAVDDKEVNQAFANTTAATSVNDEGEIVTIPPTIEEQKEHNVSLNDHYLAITENYKGYLWASGCDISDPVVQGDDNEYYLKQTYYDEPNKAGAIFMDYRVVMTEDYISPNVVIYGHNQEDGTMFGNLKRYKNNIDFYSENAFIQFNTLYDVGDYVVYGFFVTNALASQDSEGEVFRYHDYIESLKSENTFYWYLDEVYKRNQIVSPVDVKYGDKLLTLSTCSNEFTDSRFVVFARKLRPDETRESFDFTDTIYNVNAQGLDWDAITSNQTEAVTEETAPETAAPVLETVYSDSDEIGMLVTRPAVIVSPETAVPETAADTAVPETSAETTVPETAAMTTVPETANGTTVPETTIPETAAVTTGPETEASETVTAESAQ